MCRDIDKYLTYVSLSGVIISLILIFFLRKIKYRSFLISVILLFLLYVLTLSVLFLIYFMYTGCLVPG